MSLLVRKLSDDAIVPKRATPGSVGYDLASVGSCVLAPRQTAVLGTGVSIRVPDGTYGRVAPRSGLAAKHGIDVLAGVIDPDYSGELKVVLVNHGASAFAVEPGMRIAQLVLEKVSTPKVVVSLTRDPPGGDGDNQRGSDGFGSTGLAG